MKPGSLTTVFQLLRPLRPFRQVFYPVPEIRYHFLVHVSLALCYLTLPMNPFYQLDIFAEMWIPYMATVV